MYCSNRAFDPESPSWRQRSFEPVNSPPHIEIFYADVCGLCHKAMDYFRSRGLAFAAREVHWDQTADDFVGSDNSLETKERCGNVDFVPQIFINGHHIPGWRMLEPMIESGEIESLLGSS